MHVIIERTLREASQYFQNFLLHEYSERSLLHGIDARVKLISTFIFVLLSISTFEPQKIAFVIISLFLLAKLSGLSLKVLLERIWFFSLFSFLVVSPFFLSDPLYPFIFTLRTVSSLTAIQLLIMSAEFPEVISALRFFFVPKAFTSALWFAYRYAILMFQELLTLIMARESRRMREGPHLEFLRKGGESLGIFFLRTLERAERIELAMRIRGREIILPKRKIGVADLLYLFISFFILFWWVMI
ncbi:MAG: cobalt/nickel transport system permease protein [Archaeoglobi archaeon]|nr:cobalt/nickel transport system permease protein [Archaeoglobi archaeon]